MFSDGYLGLSLRAGSSYRASDLVLCARTYDSREGGAGLLRPLESDVGLFGNLQGTIDLDAGIPNRALGMTEKKLNRAEVARLFVNERGLRPAHRMGAIDTRVQANGFEPTAKKPCILPRC